MNGLYPSNPFELFGYREGGIRHLMNSEVHGFKGFQKHPGIEWAH